MARDKKLPKINSKSYFIGTAVELLFMFLLPYVVTPWAEGITWEGVAIAMIFLGEIIGIICTNDLIASGFFAMTAVVVHDVDGIGGVIAGSFGASYIWQCILLYMLAYVIVRDKTGEAIARGLLSQKWVQKYPVVMVMMLMFVLAIASIFMGVFGALMVGFALLDGIYEVAGVDSHSLTGKLLYLGSFVTMCIGPYTIGGMQGLILASGALFEASTGVNPIGIGYVVISFAILILFCVVFALCMKFVFKCDLSAFANIDLGKTIGQDGNGLTRKQIVPLIAFLVVAIYSFTASYWPEVSFLAPLKNMGVICFLTLVLAVLTLIRVDGEQVFDPVEAFTKGPSWPVIMAFASMAYVGTLLTNDSYGVKAWLTQLLSHIFDSSNPVLFVIVTVLVTVIMTNIFSNTATLLVISALVAAISGPLVDAGFNITALAVAICICSMNAYLTYASSGQATILLGHDNMDNKFLWSYGLITMLIFAVIVAGVCCVALFI